MIYALLNRLHILIAYADTPRSTQMPSGLPLQVLDHDAGENDHFRVDVIEDLAVGEVQAVGDIGGDPCLERPDDQQRPSFLKENRCLGYYTEIFMRGKRVDRASSVLLINLVKPCNTSCVVVWSRLPIFTVRVWKSANQTRFWL